MNNFNLVLRKSGLCCDECAPTAQNQLSDAFRINHLATSRLNIEMAASHRCARPEAKGNHRMLERSASGFLSDRYMISEEREAISFKRDGPMSVLGGHQRT